MEDLFEPTSTGQDALVGPLHTVTCLFADAAPFVEALTAGLGQSCDPWNGDAAAAARYLGMPAASALTICGSNRTDAGRNVQIRIMASPEAGPSVRPKTEGQILGGLSLGFPMLDMPRWEQQLHKHGIDSAIGIKEMAFTSPTGEEYISAEVHFPTAENIYLLGVRRPERFRSVGPMSAAEPIGAAAYSARCVANTDGLIEFYRDILGYEIRRDATFEVNGPSGLRLEQGTKERFVQAFAPGAATGYLVFLDHHSHRQASPAPTLGPPSRGLVMWSFPTSDLDTMAARLRGAGVDLLQAPGEHGSPLLPSGRSLIFKDPEGFPIELFEA
jgi:catechol 2,3-dioxygenase-like lactoylglutathione lyase family enzyme